MGKKIYRNRVKCLECERIIESLGTHHYVECGCPNATMVDGGRDYVRFGGNDMTKVKPVTEWVEEEDDDTFLWGVFNHDIGETVPHKLSDLDDSHIQNIELHLRTRYAPRDQQPDSDMAMYREMRHERDAALIKNHIMPELERRGLSTVDKELPH